MNYKEAKKIQKKLNIKTRNDAEKIIAILANDQLREYQKREQIGRFCQVSPHCDELVYVCPDGPENNENTILFAAYLDEVFATI